MRKNLLIGLGVLAALVVVFLIVVAMQPDEFRVTRSTTIAAPPEAVFAQVNEFRKWQAWSPWEELDPEMQRTYDGPTGGMGANYRWVGNSKVGEGQMTITESQPGELVAIRLEFIKPMEDVATTEFHFKPAGAGTEVTWDMRGEQNFLGKAMCLFMSMDKMVGGDFDKGLAKLKSVAEADAKKHSHDAPTEKGAGAVNKRT